MIATTVGVKWYYPDSRGNNKNEPNEPNTNPDPQELIQMIYNNQNDTTINLLIENGLANRIPVNGRRPVMHPTNLRYNRVQLQDQQQQQQRDRNDGDDQNQLFDPLTPSTPQLPLDQDLYADLCNPFAERWDFGTKTIEIVIDEFIDRLR